MLKKYSVWTYLLVLLPLLGLLDAAYLTWEHYANVVPPCSIYWWSDCGKVLKSSYSMFFGIIPLALMGVFQYLAELIVAIYLILTDNPLSAKLLRILTTVGAIFSLYFVYLMIFVIKSICLYCFASAIISFALFKVMRAAYPQNRSLMIK